MEVKVGGVRSLVLFPLIDGYFDLVVDGVNVRLLIAVWDVRDADAPNSILESPSAASLEGRTFRQWCEVQYKKLTGIDGMGIFISLQAYKKIPANLAMRGT